MKKTLLYRLFGIGKIPAQYRGALEGEGVLLSDEGIKGSVTYRNFRAPGRIFKWKRQWYTSSIILTRTRLLAFAYSNQIIDVPVTDARFRRLRFSLENENNLLVAFDASLFHADWSGAIEYRFKTAQAESFLSNLREYAV